MSLKEQFIKAVEDLEEENAMHLAEELRRQGCTQMDIIELLLLGMQLVGIRYEGGDYFIADLIMAGIIFRSILELDDPDDKAEEPLHDIVPCVIVGTVEGDVHDIGKDLFASMLVANGIRVYDLGVDVSPDCFLQSLYSYHARILVMSGTMTFATQSMQRTIELLQEHGLREQVKILVGGCAINQEMAVMIGADGYSSDLLSGSAMCKRWLQAEKESETHV